MSKQAKLIELLLAKKLITKEQASKAGKIAVLVKKNIEDVLIERKFIDSEKLTEVRAQVYKFFYINLLSKSISDKVLNIIPFAVAENYKIVCFDKIKGKIKVGITDPENYKAIGAINFLAKEENIKVEYYLISGLSYNKIIKQYKNLEREVTIALKTKAKEEAKELSKGKRAVEREGGLEEIIKSAPVSKIVSVIIRHAVEGKASDIHIEPMQKESRVRYRIDGFLHTSLILPKNVHNAIVARIKVLANLKLDETRLPQDGRVRITINEKEIDFRVSILPLAGEEKVVMRILDVTKGAPTLEELGFSGHALEVVKDNAKKTIGMLLVTGPTGSGKSTTLFSILNILNKENVNILTLEDPVEYFIKGVNQAQVRPEIGFTFANGLRSFLRQDPDIIMVGEIRDNETAELAIHASLTGHFVLSTLHTNNSIGAVLRLLDMKVEPFLLGSTLNVVVAQRLVRKICLHCKQEEKLPSDLLADIVKEFKAIPENIIKLELKDFEDISRMVYYKGVGCPRCGMTGYSGRIAITEALEINDALKEIIMDKKKVIRFEDVKASQEFISIKQEGILKVLKGVTTIEEVLRVMRD